MTHIVCPRCREANVHRSHRRPLDLIPRSIGMIALRCNLCNHRFFRFRRALAHPAAGAATDAAVRLHTPR
jgi:hypothetical protein